MKYLLVTLFAIVKVHTALPCCMGNYATVYPRVEKIAANSVFIVDFSESDFNLKEKINAVSFYVINQDARVFKLKKLQVNFSGSHGQVLLKVEGKLNIGDSIFFKLEIPKKTGIDSAKKQTFIQQLERQKWYVETEEDTQAPEWEQETISYKTADGSNSSVGGYTINFNCPVKDNSFIHLATESNGAKLNPVFYEITFQGQKYINFSFGYHTSIYSSICGHNFKFFTNEEYSAEIRPMDASGNFAQGSRTVKFKTTIKENNNLIREE